MFSNIQNVFWGVTDISHALLICKPNKLLSRREGLSVDANQEHKQDT
jgi:hypothetical protein